MAELRIAKKVPPVDPTVRGVINYQLKFQLLESRSPPALPSPSLGPEIPSDSLRFHQIPLTIPSDPPIFSSEITRNHSKSTRQNPKWLETIEFTRFPSGEDNLALASRRDSILGHFGLENGSTVVSGCHQRSTKVPTVRGEATNYQLKLLESCKSTFIESLTSRVRERAACRF